MAIVLDDVATYLQTQAVGTVGTDLFKSQLPDTPDTCVALIEVIGDPPLDTFRPTAGAINVERPTIQVLCRAAQDDYSAARVKAEAAYKALHGLTDATLSGTRYLGIVAKQSPFNIGRDENGRHLLGFNVDVYKEPNA